MTVLLVVSLLALLLLMDYLRSGRKVKSFAARLEASDAVPEAPPRNWPAGRPVDNLRFHPGHMWALRESPTLVRVGMDGFAAELIGDWDRVVLPKRGEWIRQGEEIVAALKDGEEADLVSPIEGEVTGVNEAVRGDPHLLAGDPYGAGWLITVYSPEAEANFRNLLGGELARHWMAEAEQRLLAKRKSPAEAGAPAGQIPSGDTAPRISRRGWNQLTHEFFLTGAAAPRASREAVASPARREPQPRTAA